MRTQTWRTAAVWAIGTCALVLAVTWPQRLNAVDQTVRDAKRVDKPQMLAGGIEYTWQASDSWCVVRGQPVKFTINATNPTSQSVQAKLTAMLEASSVSSLISRVPTVPKIIWQNDQSVALAPGASTSFVFTTPPVPSDRDMMVVVTSASLSSIIPLSVAAPATQTDQKS
jgi:hypothetical protein